MSDDSESSDAESSTSTPSGESGANAAQPDGSIGVPDASSANADSDEQQQNTAPQGAGQQYSATPPELPSDDGAQGGQAVRLRATLAMPPMAIR